MPQDNSTQASPPENSMLQQAVDAIRAEQFAQAREILTNLLHTDQQNPDYWVWMSAAMETQKERLYCLQTAFNIDPTNAAARRGLALLGTIVEPNPPQPFPIVSPPLWEVVAKQEEKRNKPKFSRTPVFRLVASVAVIGILMVGTFVGARYIYSQPVPTQAPQGTARPTVTPYATNSNKSVPQVTPVRPLDELLATPYTPTAVYAATPHSAEAGDSYKGAIRAYNNNQWENVAIMMAQVATSQPGSADALYFIGESKRMTGKYLEAINYYNAAISVNQKYAPSYLGRARASVAINPKQDVIEDLDLAIKNDPNYAEAYLERGLYYYNKQDLKSASADLKMASGLTKSPIVEMNLAKVLLAQGENAAALEAAKNANQMDITMLDGYLVLGMAYQANNQIDQAVQVLETYLKYKPDNAEAFALLGEAYFNRNDYAKAESYLLQALNLDGNNPDTYFWLGQTYLNQKSIDKALANYQKARDLKPESFDFSEGLAKAYMAKKEFNNSYIAISKIEKFINTPNQIGRFLFIRAQSLDELSQPDPAFNDWTSIMKLPVEATTEEMRQLAQERISARHSPTPAATSKKPVLTVTPTVKALVANTKTPTPVNTRFPTTTPKSTPQILPTPTHQ